MRHARISIVYYAVREKFNFRNGAELQYVFLNCQRPLYAVRNFQIFTYKCKHEINSMKKKNTHL